MKITNLLRAKVAVATLNLVFGTLICKASTSVPAGNVIGTWTLAGSPYNIQGSIQILDGTTLTIQPGVTVNFQGTYKLNVQGRLLAIGTITDTIIFTAANTNNGWQGIHFSSTPVTNDTSKIVYCKLQYGKATGSSPYDCGGGIYFNNFSKAIIYNCRISNCIANSDGGGIYCTASSAPTISNNAISNNSASRGGGICCNSSTISNNTITNNTASLGGGLYCYQGSPTISNNIISSNIANGWGAGVYCENSSNPIVTNNVISNNTSSNYGGGVYCYQNSPTISNNTISNNTANSWGGGINCDGSSPSISNNIISNNIATFGGGISCNSGSPAISNNTIVNNTASSTTIGGGGIYCTGSNPTLTNNSIANNVASNGGALYCTNTSNPTFRNCILWGNTASLSGVQVFLNDDASDPSFYYCDVQGSSTTFELNGNFYTGIYQNNINIDPLFIASSGGTGTGFNGITADWSLQVSSPCIDSGDPATVSPATDIIGNPRIIVCRVDIGAYEYQNGTPFLLSIVQSKQILCNGTNNGELVAIPSGGISPYTFSWNGGSTNDTLSNLPIGTYTATVSIASGCSRTASFTITQPAAMSLTPNKTDIDCSGNCIGSATVTATGGTFPYSYLWSTTPPQTTFTTSSTLCTGPYTVTVTDSAGCVQTASVTIATPSTLSFTPSLTHVSCHGGNNGNINVSATGGIAPLQYSINGGNNYQLSNNFTGLISGTYSIVVKDNNGCQTNIETVIITEPPSLTVSTTQVNVNCYGANNGSATAIASGGTTNYSFSWNTSPIQTTANATNLTIGNYTITVTDQKGCITSTSVSIVSTLPNSSICMVTVDSTSTKNVIVWEKPTSVFIDSFRIYREIASVYSLIGSVPYSDLSEFTDHVNGINPNTTSYKYKLSVIDSCGNESPLSSDHQTVHVQLGLAFPSGVNLSWNDYVGFTFSQYLILRDNIGNGNWQVLDSVSYGITTYTSTDVLPNARYIVEAKKPAPCVSTRQSGITRSSSKSNTASQTTGINELSNDMSIIISPNPNNGKFTIELSSSRFSNNKLEVKICNVLGERIYLSELKYQQLNEIDLSNAATGIYFVNVYNGDRNYTRKIVKQ